MYGVYPCTCPSVHLPLPVLLHLHRYLSSASRLAAQRYDSNVWFGCGWWWGNLLYCTDLTIVLHRRTVPFFDACMHTCRRVFEIEIEIGIGWILETRGSTDLAVTVSFSLGCYFCAEGRGRRAFRCPAQGWGRWVGNWIGELSRLAFLYLFVS